MLERQAPGAVHMLGVCGVGMAGLAYLLHKRGWRVSGCDRTLNGLAQWLGNNGIDVSEGHSTAHLTGVDCLVASTAIPLEDTELKAARNQGIPVYRRGEVLAELVSQARGVAICGAHGKTTTASFTARLLQELDAPMQWCIGGLTERLGAVAGGGADVVADERGLLVVEADESDGTLAWHRPEVTVVTNVDRDHLEHFADEAALQACFGRVVAQTSGAVAACYDNPGAMRAVAEARVPVLTFGFSDGAKLRAVDIHCTPESVEFDVVWLGTSHGRVRLGVGGRHNVLNALGAAAAALLLEFEMTEICKALPQACGELPKRRFELVAEVAGRRFILDYAHHPAELQAAVAMARTACTDGNLIVVFQPHRYTRTLALGTEFPAAFTLANEVIILPVYAASEKPLEGGESCDLYTHFREQATDTERTDKTRIKLARSLEETWGYLRERVGRNDLVLIAGAGDVAELAEMVRADIAKGWPDNSSDHAFEEALTLVPGILAVPYGSLEKWSFYGVGGRARWRVEVRGVEALAGVVRLCAKHKVPWRMVGHGANTWHSDLGVPGCVVRFATDTFTEFKSGDNIVEVGCGWCGQALLRRLQEEGLSGLEFLEAVPGKLGGWLAMNAGAHGREIGERIVWLRCLDAEGKITVLDSSACGFAYRVCEALKERVAIACGLSLDRNTPEFVQTMRDAYRDQRIPLEGLRTAGSLFRNPSGLAAGKLLDQAQCKSLRVGGARVATFHANIVAVESSATASDVLALALKMHGRVERKHGVRLVPEVQGLDF